MFGRLEPWQPPGDTDQDKIDSLMAFAQAEMVEATGASVEENVEIPAGYTYFGQFIDHDITFDPTSSKVRQNDPNKLKNFRTPRFDLDSVYLAGHHASPFLYDPDDPGKFLIGKGEPGATESDPVEDDLPRNDADIALVGDPRNDENIIVSQLQLAFLKLHNNVLDKVREVHSPADPDSQFAKAQRVVCWFYQYVVWNDFIKRLVHDTLWRDALLTHTDEVAPGKSTVVRQARKRFYEWKRAPYIPVEFSVAAYRFGHSMVRPGYQVNFQFGVGEQFELPIFSDPMRPSSDLRGGRVLPRGHTIQWDWYFAMGVGDGQFPQRSRKIDTKLSPAMSHIPMGQKQVPLAFLNLQRGWRMDLPSGPAVADAMGVPDAARPTIAPGTPEESLWYYVLRETSTLGGMSRKMLGPVGGTIVAEVFAGLLAGDPLSFVNLDPLWTPANEACLDGLIPNQPINGGDWEVSDLLIAAGVDGLPRVSPSGGSAPLIFPHNVPIRGERVVVP